MGPIESILTSDITRSQIYLNRPHLFLLDTSFMPQG